MRVGETERGPGKRGSSFTRLWGFLKSEEKCFAPFPSIQFNSYPWKTKQTEERFPNPFILKNPEKSKSEFCNPSRRVPQVRQEERRPMSTEGIEEDFLVPRILH